MPQSYYPTPRTEIIALALFLFKNLQKKIQHVIERSLYTRKKSDLKGTVINDCFREILEEYEPV